MSAVDATVYYNRGVLFKQQGEKEKALQDYNMAIKLNPNYATAYINRGVLFKQQGEKEKALQDYNMAIKLNPNYATVYINRGNLFNEKGEKEKALQDYNMAIKLNPNYTNAYYNRGVLFKQLGETEKANQDYNTAIHLNPNYATAYINRGNLFNEQGEKENALQDYNMAIKLNPNYADAYFNRGVLFKQQGEKEKALQDYNRAIKLNPNYATAYINRGVLFKQQQEKEKALQDYNVAIKLNPNYADAYFNRGVLFKQQGEKEKAIQDYNMAIKLNPNYATAYYNRGVIFTQKGEKEKALQDYNKAIKLNPNYAAAYYDRGVLFKQKGEKENALQDYNTTIKLNPNYTAAYYQRGVLFNEQGEKEKAIQDQEKALLLEPDHPLLLTNLGSLYFQQQSFDQSNIYLTRAQKQLDQITFQQISKWNLSNSNLTYIKKEVSLLTEIQIQIQITDILLKYISKEVQTQQTIQLEEQGQMLVDELTQTIKPLDIQLNQNLQTDYFQILQKFQQRFNNLQNQIATHAISVNSLLEQDSIQVSESLKQLNKKENYDQWMYYNALAWRLYNYLSAIQQICTNLFQNNKNAIIESNSEQTLNVFQKMLNIGSYIFGGLPIVGNSFNIINAALDFGFEYHKEHKFTTRLKKLNNILKCSSIVPGQLQIQVQIAGLELSKTQYANLINKPKSRFRKFTDQLLQEEDKQFRNNIYWAAGTEDALIILNYLEANSDMIINEIFSKKVDLSWIIIKAIKEQYELSQNISIQQQGNKTPFQFCIVQ
ncbi:unnamed protein product [Paramecium octaurelia]|uniref:UDP-N-acetylglucosamine--peptide N-acetylglucosaminyltransferase SPINDLY n=1 Tax=Paramecium octaurelia TaxID=43137 RepID=A0A8S1X5U4_PAROT|nr:unnamed protein product [Paramecium octaurelia]